MKKVTIMFLFMLVGCSASIDFGSDGLTYYDPKPYLFVTLTPDCISTATVVLIPHSPKKMKFKPGYGSSELSVTLTDGMITAVGQKTDTKIPESITAFASLGTAAAGLAKRGAAEPEKPAAGEQYRCTASATLYPIVDGRPNLEDPIPFQIQTMEKETPSESKRKETRPERKDKK